MSNARDKANIPSLNFSSTGIDDNATSTAITINSNGDLGINNTNPTYRLDLVGGSNTARFKGRTVNIDGASASDSPRLNLSLDGTDKASIIVIRNNDNLGIGTVVESDVYFTTNDTERMRITSTGSVGIGTSSPGNYKLDVNGTSNFSGNSNWTSGSSLLWNGGDIAITNSGTNIVFKTYLPGNFAERVRIDSSGNLLVGQTTNGITSLGIGLVPNGVSHFYTSGERALELGRGASDGEILRFNRSGADVGSIDVTTTSTSYNTSSDYRLKENVNYNFDATTRLKQLKPARFNFIADADKTVDGFLAHEVQDIVPEAITGEKDAMKTEEYEVTPAVLDEDGNVITEAVMGTREVPDYQGIDQSKLVPLLVKTIQELETRITALENK